MFYLKECLSCVTLCRSCRKWEQSVSSVRLSPRIYSSMTYSYRNHFRKAPVPQHHKMVSHRRSDSPELQTSVTEKLLPYRLYLLRSWRYLGRCWFLLNTSQPIWTPISEETPTRFGTSGCEQRISGSTNGRAEPSDSRATLPHFFATSWPERRHRYCGAN